MNTDHLLLTSFDLLLKSMAILTVTFTVQHFWRNASAAKLNLIWLMAFGALLLLPLTRLADPRWAMSLAEKETVQVVTLPMELPSVQAHAEMETPAVATPVSISLPNTRQTFMGIWVMGVVLVMARRMMGSWQLRRIKKQSVTLLQASTNRLASRLAHEWGVKRSVELRESKDVPVPLTWGTLRPVLMLPQGADRWEGERLTAALQHELGHIKRYDVLTRGLVDFVCAIYWINPLVWWGAKAMRLTQERACDDMVLNAGVSADGYATQLLDSARSMQQRFYGALPAVAMAQPSTLETRLLAIVDEKRDRRPINRKAQFFASLAALSVLFLSAAMQLRAEDPSIPKQTPMNLAQMVIIPNIAFQEATLEEAVEFLRAKSIQNDPGKKGINVVINAPKGASSTKLTMELKDIPLSEALRHVAELSNMKLVFTDTACVLESNATVKTVSKNGGTVSITVGNSANSMATKAAKIIIPRVEFNETKISDALDFLRVKSQELDPEKKGINLILKRPKAWDEAGGSEPLISLSFKDVPLSEALRYVAELSNMKLVFTDTACVLESNATVKTVSKNGGTVSITVGNSANSVAKKAAKIIIPRVEFHETKISDALDFLRVKSQELDPEKKGINLILKRPKAWDEAGGWEPSIGGLSLKDVPLSVALLYVSELTGMKLTAEENAYILSPMVDP